ncbi:hypothetical protein LEP1GSC192_2879 [Leptospira sp. B5-022]|nr:hypothetical protein LEP1GSC192_2879 [Leptospira sp. B5-022]
MVSLEGFLRKKGRFWATPSDRATTGSRIRARPAGRTKALRIPVAATLRALQAYSPLSR